ITILAFGDSLTAGFGLPSGSSFADQLQYRLNHLQENIRVINAGISGDTTGGGLSRIDRALEVDPDLVILELGANDAILGTLPEQVKQNLEIMITRSLAVGAGVLLAGIEPPMAFTPGYRGIYAGMFKELADRYGLTLYPDFLQGILYQTALTLPDGIHPNVKGVAAIVDNILPLVLQCLEDIRQSRGR
ncbi:MAG: arylesterase, partial [Desulfohalobiaceae bacterium]|nr:arylesterase [Desulfohalobiaceae bacterium]